MRILSIILTLLFALFWVRSTLAVEPPVPISPTNNGVVSSPKVEWQTPSYELYSSNPYRVQVDDDSSFGSVNKNYYTANTTYTPSLSDGIWYWRVKARDPSATWSDWSNVWSFILDTTPTPTPSPSPSPSSSPSPSPTSSSSSFTISDTPSQIDSTEEFSVNVNLSLPKNPNTTYYLKGAFKKEGKTNYFGLTKVNASWVKNNKSYSDHFKITTDNQGNWLGNLDLMPDILDSGYEGAGQYLFKVARYSEAGSLTWSNEVIIQINAQEVILDEEENEEEILGAVETGSQNNLSKTSDEKFSLEKYIKIASPAAKSSSSASPDTTVAGAKNFNVLSAIGTILVIIGLMPIAYAIYHIFRKRNQNLS